MPMPIKPRPRLKIPAIDLLSVNVLRLRTERGWTQDGLAYEAGLHRSQIGHIERKARIPTLETIEVLAAALAVPIAELFRPTSESEDIADPKRNASLTVAGAARKSTIGK